MVVVVGGEGRTREVVVGGEKGREEGVRGVVLASFWWYVVGLALSLWWWWVGPVGSPGRCVASGCLLHFGEGQAGICGGHVDFGENPADFGEGPAGFFFFLSQRTSARVKHLQNGRQATRTTCGRTRVGIRRL